MSDDDIDVLKPETILKPKIEQPRLYKVVLLNDDYTPREFVVQVLKAVFRTTEDQAYRIMMTAHQRGVCVVATFTRDVAESKAKEATDLGRQKGYPLEFSTEPEEESTSSRRVSLARGVMRSRVAHDVVRVATPHENGETVRSAQNSWMRVQAFAQAVDVGRVGDADVGAHAVGGALHRGDVLLLQQRHDEVGVGLDLLPLAVVLPRQPAMLGNT